MSQDNWHDEPFELVLRTLSKILDSSGLAYNRLCVQSSLACVQKKNHIKKKFVLKNRKMKKPARAYKDRFLLKKIVCTHTRSLYVFIFETGRGIIFFSFFFLLHKCERGSHNRQIHHTAGRTRYEQRFLRSCKCIIARLSRTHIRALHTLHNGSGPHLNCHWRSRRRLIHWARTRRARSARPFRHRAERAWTFSLWYGPQSVSSQIFAAGKISLDKQSVASQWVRDNELLISSIFGTHPWFLKEKERKGGFCSLRVQNRKSKKNVCTPNQLCEELGFRVQSKNSSQKKYLYAHPENEFVRAAGERLYAKPVTCTPNRTEPG